MLRRILFLSVLLAMTGCSQIRPVRENAFAAPDTSQVVGYETIARTKFSVPRFVGGLALLGAGVLQTREYVEVPELQSAEAAGLLMGFGGLLIAISSSDEVVTVDKADGAK